MKELLITVEAEAGLSRATGATFEMKAAAPRSTLALDAFLALPVEIFCQILELLPGVVVLSSVRAVCRTWRKEADELTREARPWAVALFCPREALRPTAPPAVSPAWLPADCTALLSAAAAPSPCPLAALASLERCAWAQPSAAFEAAALALLSRLAASHGLLLTALSHLPAAADAPALTAGVRDWARAALRAPAALGFWASAAALLLTARGGREARCVAAWLHALPAEAHGCPLAADELRCALEGLLHCAAWRGAATELAADWRSVASRARDEAQAPPERGLTAEQVAIVAHAPELLRPGASAKVIAYAGTGKTSTLRALVAELERLAPDKRILYTAFNKSVVQEADGSLGRAECKTTHQVANREGTRLLRAELGERKPLMENIKAKSVSDLLPGQEEKNVSAALSAVEAFLVSDDDVLGPHHIRRRSLRDDPERASAVVRLARDIARRMLDPADRFPFNHNAYLRVYARSQLRWDYDVVLVDEAQDLNGVTLRLLRRAQASGAAVVYVGDPHQHIYSFNGCRNALASLLTEARFRLTRSFRFGHELAAAASKLLRLKGELVPVLGCRGKSTAIAARERAELSGAPLLAVLVRANATWVVDAAALAGGGVPVKLPYGQSRLRTMMRRLRDIHARGNAVQEAEEAEEEGDVEARSECLLVHRLGSRLGGVLVALERAAAATADGQPHALFSTVHKGKGLEWEAVHLSGDLWREVLAHLDSADVLANAPLRGHAAEAVNLLYVALSRASARADLPPGMAAALEAYPRLEQAQPGTRCSGCGQAQPEGARMACVPLWAEAECGSSLLCAACAGRRRETALLAALLRQ